MAHAGWKGFGFAAAASAVLMMSAAADAQPGARVVPAGAAKSAPHLVAPKIDVHAPPPSWTPATIDRAASAAVAQVLDQMHRLAAQVPPASVPMPVPRPTIAPTQKADHARPVKPSPVVEAKPVVLEQPVTGIDDHGLRGQVPGIQIRLPWRIP
jgi:hypothetical protein